MFELYYTVLTVLTFHTRAVSVLSEVSNTITSVRALIRDGSIVHNSMNLFHSIRFQDDSLWTTMIKFTLI